MRVPLGFHYPASSLPALGGRDRRIPSPEIGLYWRRLRVPLAGAQGQAVVDASGAATVTLSPQATGTRWYPRSAQVTTTTGIFDGSTCTAYLGPQQVATAVIGYAASGGGATFGLAVPMAQPGDLLTFVWAGATHGDVASVNIVGDQDVLV